MKKYIIIPILFIFIFVIYKCYSYSTEYPSDEIKNEINEKYDLHLPDIEWRYTQYLRKFTSESKIIINNYYTNQLIDDCNMIITISLTENDHFMNVRLPFIKDLHKVMIEDEEIVDGQKMNIKILTLDQDDQYMPIYQITLKRNNKLYQFRFSTDSLYRKDIYSINEKEIHRDHLQIYYDFISKVLLKKEN